MADKKGWWLTLLAMAGFGGIAAATLSSASSAASPAPRVPTGEGILTPLQPTKREWRMTYRGSAPESSGLKPLPKYKIGQMVKYQAPAGEVTPLSDPLTGQVLIIRAVRGYLLWLQDTAGQWARDESRAPNWAYETDRGGSDTPIDQGWLSPATAADVPKPATAAPAVADKTKQQEAAMSLPLYPQGLVVRKGSVSGTVTAISKTGDTYHYRVKAGLGPFQSDYQGTETEVMNMLAQKTGQQAYGFAFPVGVELEAKSLKIKIAGREVKDGQMVYTTDQGQLAEPALIVKLYQATKA